MAYSGYSISTGAAVALAAATAKTVIGVKAHANSGIQLKWIWLSFDGVTSTAVPPLIELCAITWATNSPGTNSTSVTPVQNYGRVLTAGFTAGRNWTAEPTVLTVIEELYLAADKGVVSAQWPLGQEPDSPLAEGFGIRVTAPAIVNVRAVLKVERT
jgi:hypothetical protein